MTQNRRATTDAGITSRYSSCVLLGLTLLVLTMFGLMLLMLGCASGTSRKASSVKSFPKIESSAMELNSRNQSLLAIYSAEIETAADQVILESPSAAARRQALLWKTEAIPVLQKCLLNSDPVVASLDSWAFIFQMMAYMERPAIKQEFAGLYPVVAAALKNMDGEMQQLVQVAAPSANVSATRQTIASWAQAHPVNPNLAGRQSLEPVQIRKLGESDLGTMASIRALGESLGDLTDRLDSYNAYLPKQARWQAELLLSDLARSPEFSAAVSNAGVLSNALAKTSNSMEQMPELVGQTRVAVMSDVERQRLATQAFVQEERVQVFNALSRERVALTSDLNRQRTVATADLQAEVQTGLKALHDERVGAVNDARAAGENALQDFDSRARSLINRFFLYAAALMLVMLGLCSLVAWLLLRRFGRRPDRGQALYDRAA
jgi:hypothetical protein